MAAYHGRDRESESERERAREQEGRHLVKSIQLCFVNNFRRGIWAWWGDFYGPSRCTGDSQCRPQSFLMVRWSAVWYAERGTSWRKCVVSAVACIIIIFSHLSLWNAKLWIVTFPYPQCDLFRSIPTFKGTRIQAQSRSALVKGDPEIKSEHCFVPKCNLHSTREVTVNGVYLLMSVGNSWAPFTSQAYS